MPLKKYDKKSVRKFWTKKVSDSLVGKKITKVEYLSSEEADRSMWDKIPVAIQLDNKEWLVPMSDDEGNNGGAVSTTIKGLDTIPVLI
tara:strand:+ start:887 stop:1150 length:264 start_codon:yes stop_codon:yes gene_type:complete